MLKIFKFVFLVFLLYSVLNAQVLYEKGFVKFNLDSQLEAYDNTVLSVNGFRLIEPNKSGTILLSSIEVPFTDVKPFLSFGLNINIGPNLPQDLTLFISHSVNGTNWSEWEEITNDDDASTNEKNVFGSLSFINKDAKWVKLKVRINEGFLGNLDKIEYIFINPGETKTDIGQIYSEKLNSAQIQLEDFPRPPVVSRTEWGCPQGQSSGWSPSYTTVTHLIVHHSAMSNSASDWAAVVRSIWTLHTYSNNWGDVGYNYLIDPNGVVYEGRAGGDNAIGAHFCGYNGGTMGTCMMGTYISILPTSGALESLVKLLAWKSNQRGIDPTDLSYHPSSGKVLRHISGHRSGCATECPGTTLYNHLPNIRNDVMNLLLSIPPQISNINLINGQNNFLAYKPIQIDFSQAMDTAAVRTALYLSPTNDFDISWLGVNYLELRPTPHWQFSTSFTISIDTSARNIFGQQIDGNGDGVPGDPFTLNFSTTDPDNQAPFVEKGYPSGNGVNVFAEMKFVFNEVLGENALIGKVKLLNESGGNVSYNNAKIETSDDKSIVYFKPVTPLNAGSNYSVKYASGIFDMFGNSTTTDILIPFRTQSGQYVSGNVLDEFENVDGWNQPLENPASVNIDSIDTYFAASIERKRSGNYSGKLAYSFTEESNGIAFILNSTGYTVSDTSSNYGIWIFGDLSGNEIYFSFDNSNSYDQLIDVIDWYGWEYLSRPSNSVSSPNKMLTGIYIKQKENADKSGAVYLEDFQLSAITTSVRELNNVPTEFTLQQNYPNPFNPSTSIEFSIPVRQNVKLAVYDLLGNQVELLLNKSMNAGTYSVKFDGTRFASGVYIYTINTERFNSSRKMLILK